MTGMKPKKKFEPGNGYTQGDWDDVDSPVVTTTEFAKMRPATEVLPTEFFEHVNKVRRSRGRPALDNPKRVVSLRLDPDVIDKFKASGKGWQTRINDILKQAKI